MTTALSKSKRILLAALFAALPVAGLGVGSPARSAAADDAPPAGAPAAPAAPAAAQSTAGRRWMLTFAHGPLRRVQADDGLGHVVTLLYMTMTVENKTGLPRNWRPFVTGATDSRPAPYVAGGYSLALEKIRAQEGNPELQPFETTGWKKGDEGKIGNGEKRSLVAIFGPIDPYWARMTVDVQGLVNPIATLKVDKYGDKQIVVEAAYAERNAKVWDELKAAAKASGSDVPQPVGEYQEVRERRTYRIVYRRQGDEFSPDSDPIEFVSEGWYVPEGTAEIPNPKTLRTIKAN